MNQKWTDVTEYLIVNGHSVLTGTDPKNKDHWFHTDDQKDTDLVPLIIEQIEWAIRYLITNPPVLLIFSGGYTRGSVDAPIFRSEADSYLTAALQLKLIPSEHVLARIVTEPVARNSLENLLFGIGAGYEVTGVRPQRVVCAGFEHKRQRVLLHARIAGFSTDARDESGRSPVVSYCGVNDFQGEALCKFQQGETDFLNKLREEPQGMGALASVRYAARNPYRRQPRYLAAARDWPQLLGQLAIAYAPDGVRV